VANDFFGNLNKVLTEADIKALKKIYFVERKVLHSLLKQSHDGAELPLEPKKWFVIFMASAKNARGNILRIVQGLNRNLTIQV
jgi:hypothetical protein